MDPAPTHEPEGLLINEAQLLLAQKRTLLAEVRTGLAILAVPLSIISLLIVTSRLYHYQDNLWLLVPLIAVCTGMAILGGSLIIGSVIRLRRTAQELHAVVSQSPHLTVLEK